jgi:amidophosphoribosyltransferase
VHLRISSPPTTHPCYYGIDTPTRSELIASSHSPAEIARYVTCDSLGYLSIDGLLDAVQSPRDARGERVGYCAACFTGQYEVAFESPDAAGKLIRLRRPVAEE